MQIQSYGLPEGLPDGPHKRKLSILIIGDDENGYSSLCPEMNVIS